MKTKIIAHRGAWKEFNLPQNSVASLQKAIDLRCYASECDVHLTKDHIIVVNHDYDFYGLNIENTFYKDLLFQTLPNQEKISKLETFFSIAFKQNHTKLIVEIKTSNLGGTDRTKLLIDILIKNLPKYATPENVEFILFDFHAAIYLKNKLSNFFVHYLEGDKTADEILQSGLNGMDYHYNLLLKNTELVQHFNKNGLQTNSWTVNDINVATQLIQQHIFSITTDYPQLFLNTL